LEQRYKDGDRSLPLIFKYVTQISKTASPKRIEKIIRESLETNRENWKDPYAVGMMMLLEDGPNTEIGGYLVSNAEQIMDLTGSSVFMANMQFRFLKMKGVKLNKAKTNWPAPSDMIPVYQQYLNMEMADRFELHYEMLYAMKRNSIEMLSDATNTYLSKYQCDSCGDYLNFATFLYNQTDNVEVLKAAKNMALRGISIGPDNLNCYMTLSAIYDKMGQKEAALKAKEKGKAIAIKRGIPVPEKMKRSHGIGVIRSY